MNPTRYSLPTPTKTKVQAIVSTAVAPTAIQPIAQTGLLPQEQPQFDQTLDQTQILNLEPQICDFGKFANGACAPQIQKVKKPVQELGLYVVNGYAVDGYFAHS